MGSARHSKVRLLAHFVWAVDGREPRIAPEMERRLYHYISRVCQNDGCDVMAIGGTASHVHLLVSLGHEITVSQLMHHVKGGSSRFYNEAVTPEPEAPFRWQRGYGVFGVSPHDKARVVEYILNQKKHHEDGTLWPSAEETDNATLRL